MDREHHPVRETVIEGAILPLGAEASLEKVFILIPLLPRCFGKGLMALGSPSKPIFLDGLILKTPRTEISVADGMSLFCIKLLLEKLAGKLGNEHETLIPLPRS